jgi:hypothetical protein
VPDEPLVLFTKSFAQKKSSSKKAKHYSYIRKGGNAMTQQLYLMSDVSRMLSVPAHRIAYLFMTRKLSEPHLRLGNRRVFSRADVQRVAKALGRTLAKEDA